MDKAQVRQVDAAGLELIKTCEGYSNKRYIDADGEPTIGYGHLILLHEEEKFKSPISEAEAEVILREDLKIAEEAVQRLITVNLTNEQFAALVDFTYNLGEGILAESTLRKLINEGRNVEALAEFVKWDHGNGRVLPGLLKRRQEEAKMFEEGMRKV